jgi:hypothetical protein
MVANADICNELTAVIPSDIHALDLREFWNMMLEVISCYMNITKPCLLLCLLLAGCSSTPVANNQRNGNQAAFAQNQAGASKQSDVPQYSHELVTEASDGGTKFLELVSVSQE